MWLRSSSLSLDGYGSKRPEVSKCRLETILATMQEFILTKVAPVQSIIDIALLPD